MEAVVRETALYLQRCEIGTVGVNIFKYSLPATPVACVAVIPTGGTVGVVSELNIQVLVRDTLVGSASATASKIYQCLDNRWEVLSVPGYFLASHPVGSYYLSEQNHYIFPLNFVFRSVGRGLGIK